MCAAGLPTSKCRTRRYKSPQKHRFHPRVTFHPFLPGILPKNVLSLSSPRQQIPTSVSTGSLPNCTMSAKNYCWPGRKSTSCAGGRSTRVVGPQSQYGRLSEFGVSRSTRPPTTSDDASTKYLPKNWIRYVRHSTLPSDRRPRYPVTDNNETYFDTCLPQSLPREQFLYAGTQSLCDLIDEAGRRAGVSRGQSFDDFLTCSVSALSNRQMEDEYLAVVKKGYGEGTAGRRGIDSLAQAFGTLVQLMEETRKDILGDLFQGGITYGEAGQFLTPDAICRLMAGMTIDESSDNEVVGDPCCGSGRMLLAYAEQRRPRELVGQDVDLRCVRMTAINLALRNLYGYVLWGNSLTRECRLAYRTGMNANGGVIRFAHPGELEERLSPHEASGTPSSPRASTADELPPSRETESATKQLELF